MVWLDKPKKLKRKEPTHTLYNVLLTIILFLVFSLQDSIPMEERQELRRLIPRQLVATVLGLYTIYNEGESGFDLSPDPNTARGGVSLACASGSNTLARMFFMMVIFRITVTPVVLEQLRRTRESCDVNLVLGSILLLISFAISPYLR